MASSVSWKWTWPPDLLRIIRHRSSHGFRSPNGQAVYDLATHLRVVDPERCKGRHLHMPGKWRSDNRTRRTDPAFRWPADLMDIERERAAEHGRSIPAQIMFDLAEFYRENCPELCDGKVLERR